MVWRQGQSYSEDLRARVLAAVDGGAPLGIAANVSYGATLSRQCLSVQAAA
jgi:hypothetical protein